MRSVVVAARSVVAAARRVSLTLVRPSSERGRASLQQQRGRDVWRCLPFQLYTMLSRAAPDEPAERGANAKELPAFAVYAVCVPSGQLL